MLQYGQIINENKRTLETSMLSLPEIAKGPNAAQKMENRLTELKVLCGKNMDLCVIFNNFGLEVMEAVTAASPDAATVLEKNVKAMQEKIEASGNKAALYSMACRPVISKSVQGPNGSLMM